MTIPAVPARTSGTAAHGSARMVGAPAVAVGADAAAADLGRPGSAVAALPALAALAILAGALLWRKGPMGASVVVEAVVISVWAGAAVVTALSPQRRLAVIVGGGALAGGVAILAAAGLTSAGAGTASSTLGVVRPLAAALVPAALMHVVLALPDGVLGSGPRRLAVVAGYVAALGVGLGLWTARPGFPAGAVIAEAAGMLAVAALPAHRRYQSATAIERQRLQWVGCSVAIVLEAAVVLGALRVLVDWPHPLLTVLGGVSGLVAVGLAAGNSRRLVGRSERLLVSTVSLAGLSGVVLAVYLFVVIGLGDVPHDQNRSVLLLSMVAAGVAAVLYAPARGRLSLLANRLVYGAKEAPDEALRTWGGRLSRAIPMDELLLQLAESLRKTMGSAAEVWTGGQRRFERVASVPERGPATLRLSPEEEPVLCRAGVVGRGWLEVWLPDVLSTRPDAQVRLAPIVNSGELLGVIVVERRAGDEAFTEEDDRVLTELARQVGLALHNMQLDTALQASLDEVRRQAEELAASRARIVAAADASRREIERNLHDGAQQHLVAMTVKMRLAMQMVDSDPASAKAMLDELRTDLQAAVQELRDLAHGIYPPLLMDRGLESALSAAAGRSALRATVDTEGVGRYPSEVEAAVYFCCLEAIQNAGKHAGEESTLTLNLRQEGDELSFEVADDGAGFDLAARGGGHGFVNMADRLGAIGGSLEVDSAPGAGTRIRGRVPVA